MEEVVNATLEEAATVTPEENAAIDDVPELSALSSALESALESTLGYLEQYLPRKQIVLVGLSFATALCYLTALFMVKVFFGGWKNYKELKASRQKRFDVYIVSTFNSIVVSGWALWEIIFTFIFKQKSTNLEMHVVAVLGGYFVYDLIESFGEWLKYKDTFIHHVIGAFLCYYIFLTEGLPYAIPHFLVIELSTIFLNISWLLRETGFEKAKITSTVQISFAVSFALTRCVWFPAYSLLVLPFSSEYADISIFAKVGWYALIALQYYWFWQIMKKFGELFMSKKKN